MGWGEPTWAARKGKEQSKARAIVEGANIPGSGGEIIGKYLNLILILLVSVIIKII